jgi:hypothetical protein
MHQAKLANGGKGHIKGNIFRLGLTHYLTTTNNIEPEEIQENT